MPEGETSWTDLVHGTITFPNKDIGEGDFIILRSDGTPIYNLAVVSDDIAMRITLVMRGDDHISNTPKQILLYEALGAPLPQFAHLPMIHGMDGKKLSKRHGATAVGDYQHMGILPRAMVNFLALLGWSPGNDIEVMTVPQMIELFSTEGLSKNAAIFDTKKLEWMNGQHLAMMSAAELAPLVTRALVAAGLATEAELAIARCVVLHAARSAQGSRAHDRRHRATGDAVSARHDRVRSRGRRQAVEGSRSRRATLLSATHDALAALDALDAWEPDVDGSRAARARGVARDRRREDLPAATRRAHRVSGESRDLRRARNCSDASDRSTRIDRAVRYRDDTKFESQR